MKQNCQQVLKHIRWPRTDNQKHLSSIKGKRKAISKEITQGKGEYPGLDLQSQTSFDVH